MAIAATSKTENEVDSDQANLIRAELEKICKDPLFKDTTRMKRFLRFVTEETLEGRGERLKGYVIGLEVFDRPDDFDPQADTIVRVQAGQLRRRLDLFYSERGRNSVVRILVPKGRYAPTFEMRQTPQNDEKADLQELTRPRNSQSVDPRPSIAVMTLDNLSAEEERDGTRFAEGLSAEIVNALVQFRAMRIVTLTPRVTSSYTQRTVREIGEECGADFVLSGSVRRDGGVFRVTVSLIKCAESEHIFSRVFDREYEPGSVFNLQEEIASYTASAVAAPFGAVNRFNRSASDGRQDSMEAYACVLRYYDLKLTPTAKGAQKLLNDLEVVTRDNPDFSAGWSIQALLNVFLATQSLPVVDAEVRLIEADRTGRRALSADSQNAMGYYALFQSYYHRGDFDNAGKMIRQALSLNPNDYSVLAYYGICLAMRGETDRALAMQAAALRLIGRPPGWYYVPEQVVGFRRKEYESLLGVVNLDSERIPVVSWMFGLATESFAGNMDTARRAVDKALSRNPNFATDASDMVALWRFDSELSQQTYEGLSLVGLDIESLKSSI